MASAQPQLPASTYPKLYGKLPERSAAGTYGSAFAGSSNRDGARLERERLERVQREAQSHAAAAGSPLASQTDEQREEINEAVRYPCVIKVPGRDVE